MKPLIHACKALQKGLSLVELLIAMAIGLFISGIMASLYINMQGSFRYQENLARLQEGGRFAMEALTRDIRMAGYNGCGSLTDFANVVNNGATNPYLNFSSPILGYEGGVSTFPTAIVNANLSAGTDAIILIGVDSSSEIVVQSHNAPSAQINTNQHSIKAGTILLITDCSHSTLLQMTGPSSANPTNVVHNTGTGSPGNCTKFLGASCDKPEKSYTYKPGSSLARIYSNAYFIAPSSTGTGRSLWSMSMAGQTAGAPAAQELIEGVENMQITYGLDTNADSSADQFLKANSISTADWPKVVLVRLSILVASTKDGLTSKPQTYEYAGDVLTATDRKLRKAFTESITVRNRTP